MEFTKMEATVVEQVLSEVAESDVRQLSELQLALIGGGIGDVVWG